MGLLDISQQEAVPADNIKSDGPSPVRKGKWHLQLQELAEKFISGEFPQGGYVEIARFNSAAGARVKRKALQTGDRLPWAGSGTFGFKCQTWLDSSKVRRSSLYATFVAGS